ncbi:MAG TPA: FAD-dependent oxidoreductase [Thermodesulfobacteriota bacterium]|nr:FAD-dependent oxidoreductase [Thermodesulfobacteriota bacterium]
MTQDLYDTVIIGGGPAGAAAAIYAARKRLKALVITEKFGGQSVVSGSIQNWVGELALSGLELSEKLKKHVQAQGNIEIEEQKVTEIVEEPNCIYRVLSDKGGSYRSKTLIIASGATRRRLNVSGEDKFDGKGVAFCSTCDAPFFSDLEVAVAGSGNSALETVVDLLPYAKKIYLIIRSEKLKGDPVNQEKVAESAKVQVIRSAEIAEILGDQSVTGLRYEDKKAQKAKELTVGGIFIEIGLIANSEFARGLVDLNEAGEIIVDHATGQTSKPGIFAAGDVTNDPFKQNNIAAGDGVRAALSASNYILNIKKYSPCAEKWE